MPRRRVRLVPVSGDDAATLSIPRSGVWPVEWALQKYLRQARLLAPPLSSAEEKDAIWRLIHRLLSQSAFVGITGVKTAAALASANRWQYMPTVKRLACCALHLDRDSRAMLENGCLATVGAPNLLFLVDAARYDETPMSVAADSLASAQAAQNTGSAIVAPAPGAQLTLQRAQLHIPATARKARGVKKLLQSEISWGFIVRDPSTGTFETVVGRSATWLQLLERNTGEVLLESARRRSTLTAASESFAHKVRMSQTDAHGGNLRCERGWEAEHGPSWAHLGLTCSLHKIAAAHTKVFQELMGNLVSGQINFALALNEGTGILRFKDLVRAYVFEKLDVLRGSPPPEAAAYKRHVLRLCLARGARMVEKRLALLTLPNGDWRLRDTVQVYVPAAAVVDRDALAETIASSLNEVLLPGRFTLYPRNRWTKADEALDQFCLLEAVHGLASAVFPPWRELATIKAAKAGGALRWPAPIPAVPHGPAPQDPLIGHGDANHPEGAPPDGVHEVAVRLAEAPDAPERLAPGPAAGADDMDSKREENERHRRAAQQWLNTSPLGAAFIVRQCIEPLRRLLKNIWFLEASGLCAI